MKKRIYIVFLMLTVVFSFAACGRNQGTENEENEKVQNGPVESPEDFLTLGLYIDVVSEKDISEVAYEVVQEDIAVVKFVYNGLDCELRGSCSYSGYELAGIRNTSTGDMIVSTVGGCNATIYELNPGRVVFWGDEQINYSLYTYVSANDTVLKEILSCVVFENHYNERPDISEEIENASVVFAKQIVEVFQNRDMEALSEMLYYPQQLGNGQSASNISEFMMISSDEIFTDILLEAVNSSALADLRQSEDGSEYIIGTNYKNVHFAQQEDGSFKITKINN